MTADRMITAAAGCSTTAHPNAENGLIPFCADSQIPTHNADADAIEEAIGPRTRAIILVHPPQTRRSLPGRNDR